MCVWRGEAERWRWGRLRKRTRKKKECWGIREWCFPVSFHFSKSLISSEGKRAIGQVVTVGEHTQTFSYQPRLLEIELVYHSHCLRDSPGDGLDRVRGSQTFCPGSCLWLRFSNRSTLVTVWKSSWVWLNASRKILSAVHSKNDNYNCKYTVFLTQVGGVHTANVTSTVGNDIVGSLSERTDLTGPSQSLISGTFSDKIMLQEFLWYLFPATASTSLCKMLYRV